MKNNQKPIKWSEKSPNREGHFWFYGDPHFGSMGGDYSGAFQPDRKLHLVEVRKISNGFMAVCDGQFMSLSPFDKKTIREGYVGLWAEAVLPETPTEAFEAILKRV